MIEIRPSNNKIPTPYKEPEFLGDFVYDQMTDLLEVMDAFCYFPEIDQSGICLFGHSMGGLATVYAAVMRQNYLRGMILVELSFQYPESMKYEYEKKMPAEFYPFLPDAQFLS